MHTPGLLGMQLHMFAGDAAKGIGWMTGAQDFGQSGRLRERKNSWHRIQLSSYQELARVSKELDNFCIDGSSTISGWKGQQSFPKRIPFGGRWFGWIC